MRFLKTMCASACIAFAFSCPTYGQSFPAPVAYIECDCGFNSTITVCGSGPNAVAARADAIDQCINYSGGTPVYELNKFGQPQIKVHYACGACGINPICGAGTGAGTNACTPCAPCAVPQAQSYSNPSFSWLNYCVICTLPNGVQLSCSQSGNPAQACDSAKQDCIDAGGYPSRCFPSPVSGGSVQAVSYSQCQPCKPVCVPVCVPAKPRCRIFSRFRR